MSEPRVLVCDDDQAIRHLLISLLRREGYVVDLAATGDEALRMLYGLEYEAVILDLMLPAKTGFEILAQLRGENPTLLARTIVLTASPHAMRDPPADIGAFFSKPFNIGDLAAAIKRIVASKP